MSTKKKQEYPLPREYRNYDEALAEAKAWCLKEAPDPQATFSWSSAYPRANFVENGSYSVEAHCLYVGQETPTALIVVAKELGLVWAFENPLTEYMQKYRTFRFLVAGRVIS